MIRSIVGAFLFAMVLGNSAMAQCTVPTTINNGDNASATTVMQNFNGLATCVNNLAASVGAPRGYLSGLTLSTLGGSTAFGVAPGVVTSDSAVANQPMVSMNLATSYSKTTAAWALGSGAGSLDTGTIANNTWYHVYLIQRIDTQVVDVLISLSATGPTTLPTNYTKWRRIGSIKTNGAGQWILFHQLGDEFLWDAVVGDAIGVSPGNTTGTLYSLSVPTGVQVYAETSVLWFFVSSGNYVQISSPDVPTVPVGVSSATLYSSNSSQAGSTQTAIRTNTSGQIRARSDGTGGSLYINTLGWMDHRGKDN